MPQPAPEIRVLTVDDHALMREGIAAVIERQPGMTVVGEAANGLQALAQFRELKPDVTLMDLQMPEMDGVDAIQAIRQADPQARVLVLTTYKGDVQAWRALKAGALGYLLKSSLRTDLIDAIRCVHAGGRWILPEVSNELAQHVLDAALTDREVEVLHRIAAGHSNREIGALLSVTEEAIKARMKSILAKLGAKDRTHAVAIALKRGIINL